MQDSARLFLYSEIMTSNFSPQLLEKASEYFSRRFKRPVSADEAEQFLLSLTHLYDLFLLPRE